MKGSVELEFGDEFIPTQGDGINGFLAFHWDLMLDERPSIWWERFPAQDMFMLSFRGVPWGNTVAVGIGGMGSSLLAGWLLDAGGPEAPYWVGGAGAVAVLALVPRWLPQLAERERES